MIFLYQQLTDQILERLPKGYRANFYSWMTDGKMINEGQSVTTDTEELCQIDYTAIFWFEQLPYKQIDPLQLLTQICLMANEIDEAKDYFEKNQQVEFEITPLDDDTVDLEITINFREPVYGILNPSGNITSNGKNYELGEFAICTAEKFHIVPKLKNGLVNDNQGRMGQPSKKRAKKATKNTAINQ